MYARLTGQRPKQYETFTAWDWKNKRIAECSCDPAQLASYFVESNLPFETTPAFFNPEVLSRYKQDPGKYHIDNWSIDCRGGWWLRYHTNEEGQVHALLIDLSGLPYSEQMYWRSFNEAPKAGLAERAIKADFEGSFELPYDPLDTLKALLLDFPKVTLDGQETYLWVFDDDSFNRLTYVHTDSRKEWEDFILTASKLLVEGLSKKTIKRMAERLGCSDDKLGSIKLIQECLFALGQPPESVDTIIQPLGELWHFRSALGAAHRGGAVKPGPTSYPKDSWEMLTKLHSAMEVLAELIRAGHLNT
jgi:hypothetical protein